MDNKVAKTNTIFSLLVTCEYLSAYLKKYFGTPVEKEWSKCPVNYNI